VLSHAYYLSVSIKQANITALEQFSFQLRFTISNLVSQIYSLFSGVYAPTLYKRADYIDKKTLDVFNVLKLVLLDRYLINISKPVASKLVSESSYTRVYALGELIVPLLRLENIFERSTPVATVARTRVSDSFTQIVFF
jgi:hypothetical protein